jgi:hypothetical protein
MPSISTFYGIIIWMFYADHQPPHFHVEYGEHKAIVMINTLELTAGGLPRRALSLVLEWAAIHRAELIANWELCRQKQKPHKIPPLE